MLAQNFKTAADLGIAKWEREALTSVLGRLERGELKHASFYTYDYVGDCFNMCTTGQSAACGTAACIAGWAYLIAGKKSPDADDLERRASENPDLYNLYFPNVDSIDAIKPEQAAIALRNFLTVGAPRWNEAITTSD